MNTDNAVGFYLRDGVITKDLLKDIYAAHIAAPWAIQLRDLLSQIHTVVDLLPRDPDELAKMMKGHFPITPVTSPDGTTATIIDLIPPTKERWFTVKAVKKDFCYNGFGMNDVTFAEVNAALGNLRAVQKQISAVECPYCGHRDTPVDGYTKKRVLPKPDDAYTCGACSMVSFFVDSGTLRKSRGSEYVSVLFGRPK